METTPQKINKAKPWKSKVLVYLLIFSYRILSEEDSRELQEIRSTESVDPNSFPNNCAKFTKELMSAPPVVFSFIKEDNLPITVSDIFMCIREGYLETSDNPETNNVLGYLLDALSGLSKTNHKTVSASSILSKAISETIDEASLKIGSIIFGEDFVGLLKLSPVNGFILGEK